MRRRKNLWILLMVFTVLMMSAADIVDAAEKRQVVIWGLNPKGWWGRILPECQKAFPDLNIIAQDSPPGTAGQTLESMAKLITAIAAGLAPDITQVDRFMVSSVALRGLLEPLDPFIDRDKLDMTQFFPGAIEEVRYKGKFWALPRQIDIRVFFYNRDLFEENGLDSSQPPATWSQLKEISLKLTKTDSSGRYTIIGFAPTLGDPWFYTYGWLNGGEFISEDGTKCTANDPRIVSALHWVVDFYKVYGGAERVDELVKDASGEDRFVQGKIAMIAARHNTVGKIYGGAPDMDFGVAPIPIPDERLKGIGIFAGKPKYIAGAGGWSWAIPKGAKNPTDAWRVIKWLSTNASIVGAQLDLKDAQEKGQPYFPGLPLTKTAAIEISKTFPLIRERKYQEAAKVIFELLKYSRGRPVTPVASELWRELGPAVFDAIYLRKTPQAALDQATKVVQQALDKALSEVK